MKNTFRTILVAAVCVLSFSACHQDLDIIYDNALSASNMWKDPSDLEQSVPGIYQRMRSYFVGDECNVFYFGEVRVGDGLWGPSLESKVADNFKIACRHNTLNGSSTIGWSGLYSTIDQANAVLAHSASCNAAQSRVDWANAQALFARAFCYFYAARIWGDVPLNLNPVESTSQPECYPEQATRAEVYAQVEKDILDCEALGDVLGNEKYFGTKASLELLKAEYAMWMLTTQGGDRTKYLGMAREALDAFGISSNKLMDKYADVFSRDKKRNNEVVFALANNATDKGGYQVYFCQPANLIKESARCNNGGPVPISSTQWWAYPESFVKTLKESQEAGDTRVATNLGYGPYAASDSHEITWCNKLLGDMSKAPVVLDNDLLYYRAGLAIMLDAELRYYNNDFTGALKSLNIIANRAYGKDVYTDASKNAVYEALVKEYYLEFPAEGVIWWALIRLGEIWNIAPDSTAPDKTFSVMKEKNPNILLWPIANGSINKNPKLNQIEGWS